MISVTIFKIANKEYKVDLSKPIDLSIPLKSGKKNPNAWCIDPPKMEPVVLGDWIGNVQQGAAVNFNDINFNPHAHGTHTECFGHITEKVYSINDCLKTFFFIAELITISPEKKEDDFVITKGQLQKQLKNSSEALVIRTLPNSTDKLIQHYSNTNPPYLNEAAALYLREIGVKHLLIDLPSIDKEKDNGMLLAHKAFWDIQGEIRLEATITEFIYVDNTIKDGMYLLNLQIAPFENDATPSKPVLYKIK